MRSALLNIMVQAATKAGRSLTKDFGEVENLQVSRQGTGRLRLQCRPARRADRLRRAAARPARPMASSMEEGGEVKGSDGQHRWIVDPLDGTTNFLHGIPMFAVAIALERGEEIVASVIYNPIMDELYTAEKGGGAWLNDRKRLRVAGRKHLADCVDRHRHQLARHAPATCCSCASSAQIDAGRRRHPPHRLGLDRSRLGRRRPLRRLLGSRPGALGRRAGLAAAARSRRHHDRLSPASPAASGTARSSPATRPSRASCSRSLKARQLTRVTLPAHCRDFMRLTRDCRPRPLCTRPTKR